MIVETILFLVFVAAVGDAIVKIYEWRQDVLYGPYMTKCAIRQSLHLYATPAPI